MNVRMRCAAMILGVAVLSAIGETHAQVKPAPPAKDLVAVLELDGIGASKAQVAGLSEQLRAELLNTGLYRLVDRAQMDKVLEEQALQQTGCTSQECAVQVGKILGVRKLIAGRVTKLEDTLWQVSAILVDVESAETLQAVTVNQDGNYRALLTTGVASLAAKLTGGSGVAAAPRGLAPSPQIQQAAVQAPSSGPTFRDPTTGMEFVSIPGGTYEQGCHANAGECYEVEKPSRRVTLRSFWLGKTSVTRGAFAQFVRDNGYTTEAEKSGGCLVATGGKWRYQADKNWRNPGFNQDDTHPAACVSWNDAQAFIQWLSGKSGQRYRLPSEAEWEYACRSGGKAVLAGTSSGQLSTDTANYSYTAGGTTPVTRYPANGLGLYDMSGNVSQWTEDVFDENAYRSGSADNPINESSGADRVSRGGGWYSEPRSVRCSNRLRLEPSNGGSYQGFRLARDG